MWLRPKVKSFPMQTPLQYRNGEPLPLPSRVIFFHDWRHVNHGYPGWMGPDDQPVKVFGLEPLPAIHYQRGDTPCGIRLAVEPPRKSEPFLRPESPWEGMIGAPNLLFEEGRYRLWYESVPPHAMESATAGHTNVLCYAESDDGAQWRRPVLGQYQYQGAATNIVYGGDLAGPWGYHGGGVFMDPSAPPAERYKAFYLALLSEHEVRDFQQQFPGRAGSWPPPGAMNWGMAGAVSPDGIRWQRLEQPLVVHLSDTHNTCCYDEALGAYVAFMRTWVLGRRSIGRAQTKDFRQFNLPETILWPGAAEHPTNTWYGNGKTVYPGTCDYHLMFPWNWKVGEDRFFTHLMTSPDGMLWDFPQRDPVLVPGPAGAWDTGGVISGCGMVPLPGGRVAIPYIGYRIPHKYPRRPPLAEFAWAWWEEDRLMAVEAPEEGEFSTWVLEESGGTLRINAATTHAGMIQVEVLGADRRPLPGRSLADCDVLSGDLRGQVVSWRGQSGLFPAASGPFALRVKMRQAKVYSLRFG